MHSSNPQTFKPTSHPLSPQMFIAKIQGVSIGIVPQKKVSRHLRAFIQLCIQPNPALR